MARYGRKHRLVASAFACVAFLMLPLAMSGQTTLCLKDGSCQRVKSYEVKGDRVRYYSLDRSEWEEIPLSMVDFTASRRADAARQTERQRVLQEAEQTEKSTYALPANTGYLIAPGVRLPAQQGLYAYAGARVITMIQSAATVQTDKRRLALRMALPAPVLKDHPLMTLPGSGAAVRILATQPVFYAYFSDGAGANLQLLRVKPRKNDRIIEGVESWLDGKAPGSQSALPVERTQLAAGLFRISPARPLAPGEYAFAEVGQDKVNLDVWDFGIDSAKPSK